MRGIRLMTPTEMETLLQNVDTRLTRIERILPTLATKEDLEILGRELRTDFTERIETSANGLRVLIEAARDDTRVLAEHVLELITRFPRQP
jgi:hypothetical protein